MNKGGLGDIQIKDVAVLKVFHGSVKAEGNFPKLHSPLNTGGWGG